MRLRQKGGHWEGYPFVEARSGAVAAGDLHLRRDTQNRLIPDNSMMVMQVHLDSMRT
jgi:hypothetical protein